MRTPFTWIATLAAAAALGLAAPGCGREVQAAGSVDGVAACGDCARTLALVGGPCPGCVAKSGGDIDAAMAAMKGAPGTRPSSAQRKVRAAGGGSQLVTAPSS